MKSIRLLIVCLIVTGLFATSPLYGAAKDKKKKDPRDSMPVKKALGQYEREKMKVDEAKEEVTEAQSRLSEAQKTVREANKHAESVGSPQLNEARIALREVKGKYDTIREKIMRALRRDANYKQANRELDTAKTALSRLKAGSSPDQQKITAATQDVLDAGKKVAEHVSVAIAKNEEAKKAAAAVDAAQKKVNVERAKLAANSNSSETDAAKDDLKKAYAELADARKKFSVATRAMSNAKKTTMAVYNREAAKIRAAEIKEQQAKRKKNKKKKKK